MIHPWTLLSGSLGLGFLNGNGAIQLLRSSFFKPLSMMCRNERSFDGWSYSVIIPGLLKHCSCSCNCSFYCFSLQRFPLDPGTGCISPSHGRHLARAQRQWGVFVQLCFVLWSVTKWPCIPMMLRMAWDVSRWLKITKQVLCYHWTLCTLHLLLRTVNKATSCFF